MFVKCLKEAAYVLDAYVTVQLQQKGKCIHCSCDASAKYDGEFNVDAVYRTTGTEHQEIICSVFPADCSPILDIHNSKPTDSSCSYCVIVNLHIKHMYNRFKKYHHPSVFQSNCANTN